MTNEESVPQDSTIKVSHTPTQMTPKQAMRMVGLSVLGLSLRFPSRPGRRDTSIKGEAFPVTPQPKERPRRNAPCLCGSGKKFKKCCRIEPENPMSTE